MKRPSFQFYPADWRKDPALSTCSLAARGLWIELMCVVHESDEYGHLSINGKPMSAQQIARTVGETPAVIGKLIDELEQSGVFSRNEQGSIFSRRMVKDERIRNIRADSGRLGGNPNLVNQKDNQKDNQKTSNKVNQKQEQILTPSSSSSSSSSSASTKSKPVKNKNTAQIAPECVFPEIENRQFVTDWLVIRKVKDAAVTQTALDGIAREARKAGMQIEDTIRMCCERNWSGFKASWLDGDGKGIEAGNDQARETARAMLFGGAQNAAI